ncbi:MAG: septum formation initiator family protein [Deltaproteobacteria bacterium]|nr:septum formation initiator family protein [Deltaproteobacteria bacterium]
MNSSHPVFAWLVRALGVAVLVLAYSLFLGPYGFSGLTGLERTVTERSDRVLERIQANAALEDRLESLRNDPRSLETELRSTQNWVRPGEVTVILPSGAEPVPGEPRRSPGSAPASPIVRP